MSRGARVRRALAALAAAALPLAACGVPPGGVGSAPVPSGFGLGPRGDRILLTAFDIISGVAVTPRTVYAESPDGIAIYDRAFARWELPVTRIDGWPGGTVNAVAADPMEDGVWVGLTGMIVYYQHATAQLTTSIVPGLTARIVFDRADPGAGAYVLAAGGWVLATRTGLVTAVPPSRVPPASRQIAPFTLIDVYRRWPGVQSAAPLLTRDARLRSWPVISGTRSPDRTEVWLGTAGGGLWRVDPISLRGEPLPYGLLATGTGALARTGDTIWMASRGLPGDPRGGVTAASTDLQRWRWLEGTMALSLAGVQTNRMAVRGSAVWLATDRGLVLLDARDSTRALVWSLGTGLPSDQALAVAAVPNGAWVGTARGLAFVRDDGRARAARPASVGPVMLSGVPVRALVLRRDTLWAGSDDGLYAIPGASTDSVPRRVTLDARLERPIAALAASDSVLAAVTSTALVVFDPARGLVLHAFDGVSPATAQVVHAMTMDARTIWIAGDGGVIVVQRAGAAPRVLPVPAVVPAESYDVALDPEWAWIATRAGVLRLRRVADGGVR